MYAVKLVDIVDKIINERNLFQASKVEGNSECNLV